MRAYNEKIFAKNLKIIGAKNSSLLEGEHYSNLVFVHSS